MHDQNTPLVTDAAALPTMIESQYRGIERIVTGELATCSNSTPLWCWLPNGDAQRILEDHYDQHVPGDDTLVSLVLGWKHDPTIIVADMFTTFALSSTGNPFRSNLPDLVSAHRHHVVYVATPHLYLADIPMTGAYLGFDVDENVTSAIMAIRMRDPHNTTLITRHDLNAVHPPPADTFGRQLANAAAFCFSTWKLFSENAVIRQRTCVALDERRTCNIYRLRSAFAQSLISRN